MAAIYGGDGALCSQAPAPAVARRVDGEKSAAFIPNAPSAQRDEPYGS